MGKENEAKVGRRPTGILTRSTCGRRAVSPPCLISPFDWRTVKGRIDRVGWSGWSSPCKRESRRVSKQHGVFRYRSSSLSGATRRLKFRVDKGSNRLRVNVTRWSRGYSSGLSNTAISSSNCCLRARVKNKELGPLASRSRASCTIGLRRRTVDGRWPIWDRQTRRRSTM